MAHRVHEVVGVEIGVGFRGSQELPRIKPGPEIQITQSISRIWSPKIPFAEVLVKLVLVNIETWHCGNAWTHRNGIFAVVLFAMKSRASSTWTAGRVVRG